MIGPPEKFPDQRDPDAAALSELQEVFARAEQPSRIVIEDPSVSRAGDGEHEPPRRGWRGGGRRRWRRGRKSDEPGTDANARNADGTAAPTVGVGHDDDADDDAGFAADAWSEEVGGGGDDSGDQHDGVDATASAGPPTITIIDADRSDVRYADEYSDEADIGSSERQAGDANRADEPWIIDDGSGAFELPTLGDEQSRVRIDPKLRVRRAAVKRALGRRRLRWVIAGAVLLAVLLVAGMLLAAPWFSISASRVEVFGAVYADREALEAVIDDMDGTPTLLLDSRAVERRIQQIPWVLEARVRTRFPRSAVIEIAERSPVATYQGPDGRFRVIDRQGRVLDVIEGQPVAYVLIDAPGSSDLVPGQFTPTGPAAASQLVQALTPSIRPRAEWIEVDIDGSSLVLYLSPASGDGPSGGEPIQVSFGSATDLLVKLVRLETVLPAALESGARFIDVSTAEVTIR